MDYGKEASNCHPTTLPMESRYSSRYKQVRRETAYWNQKPPSSLFSKSSNYLYYRPEPLPRQESPSTGRRQPENAIIISEDCMLLLRRQSSARADIHSCISSLMKGLPQVILAICCEDTANLLRVCLISFRARGDDNVLSF